MSPQTEDPTPMPGSAGYYPWLTIVEHLQLKATDQIFDMILEPSFLEPWTEFRDNMPLKRDSFEAEAEDGEEYDYGGYLDAFVSETYHVLESMCRSGYDRPTASERESWSGQEFLECFLYQCVGNLARPDCAFENFFYTEQLDNKAGLKTAKAAIAGVYMLAWNLIIAYKTRSPNDYVERIEEAKPALDPDISPIREVRKRARLARLGSEELERRVLGGDRRGQKRREWLIDVLVKKDTKTEGNVLSVGQDGGEKRSSVVEEDEPKKKIKLAETKSLD